MSRHEIAGRKPGTTVCVGWDHPMLTYFVENDFVPKMEEDITLVSQWARLSKLYCRPIAWLQGEAFPSVQVPADVHDLMERKNLTGADRGELVKFVEFLQHRSDTKARPPTAEPSQAVPS